MSAVAPTLQAFFTDRLARQRQVSPRTIASYRDTLRLLLCFAQATTGKSRVDAAPLMRRQTATPTCEPLRMSTKARCGLAARSESAAAAALSTSTME